MYNLNKAAHEFIKKHCLLTDSLTVNKIKDIIKSYGFKIYEYGCYSSEAEELLKRIDALEYAEHTNSFTYYDGNNMIVFIRAGLGEDDRLSLLLHECCHIYLDHPATCKTIIDTDVKREHDANLLAELITSKLNRDIKVKRVLLPAFLIVVLSAVIICLIGININNNQLLYERPNVSSSEDNTQVSVADQSEALLSDMPNANVPSSEPSITNMSVVYWTESGEVYHLYKDCQHIRDSIEVFSGTPDSSGKERCCKTCLSRAEEEMMRDF